MSDKKEKSLAVPKKKKSTLWGIIKWSFILLFFAFVLFTILANIGGNSIVIKDALEELFSEQSGYDVRIETLNEMTFFPYVSVDVQDIKFYRKLPSNPDVSNKTVQDTPKLPPVGEALMSIEKLQAAIAFFDLVLGRSHIRHFDLVGLKSEKGTFLDQAVIIDTAQTREKTDQDKALKITEKAMFEIKGQIGETPLLAYVGLGLSGSDIRPIYNVEDQRDVEVSLGKATFIGRLKNKRLGGLRLTNGQLSYDGDPVFNGDFDIGYGEENANIRADITLASGLTSLSPDITFSKKDGHDAVTGNINVPKLNTDDIAPLMVVIDSIKSILKSHEKSASSNPFGLKEQDIDVKIDIQSLHIGQLDVGSLKLPVSLEKGVLKLMPLSGKVSDGTVSGHVVFNGTKASPVLSSDIKIKAIDHAALQEQFTDQAELTGKADIALQLTGEGNNADEIKKTLKGSLSIVAGKGQMRSKILDLWGSGLLNAMVPDFSDKSNLNVNCAVMNLDIESQTASVKTLFLDTERVRVTGAGQYNVAEDNLNIKLEPKAKEISIGDISPAVILTGPISSPSINPSALDVGKKIGGLLLGAVNPAFYALTLVDMDLGDQHPCKGFVIESEQLGPMDQESEK